MPIPLVEELYVSWREGSQPFGFTLLPLIDCSTRCQLMPIKMKNRI